MAVALPEKDNAAAAIIGAGGEEACPGEGCSAIAREEEEEVKWLGHYSSEHSILLVGDGDFSFSLALSTAFGSAVNLVATSLDTYEALRSKYSRAESNLAELRQMGATILHGVNAKTMKLHTDLKRRRFDRIVFNFPHAGFKGKEDQVHVINLHKELVKDFFCSASLLLRPYGEVHVSHKTKHPYRKWNLEELASEFALVLIEQVDFHIEDYPGYNNKRGDGLRCDQPFLLGKCSTFKFKIGDLQKNKRVYKHKFGSISSIGGNVHPDIVATGCRRLHPPIVPTWPQTYDSPVNMAGIPMASEFYHPVIVQRCQPAYPISMCGATRADVYQHGIVQPSYNILQPSRDILVTPGGIPQSSSSITSINFSIPQDQRQHPRTLPELLERGDRYYFAQEYQKSLRRDYDMHRNAMSGAAYLDYVTYLGLCLGQSVQKQAVLRSMIAMYGTQ